MLMSRSSSRGTSPADAISPSRDSEAHEELLLGEIDALQKRQTALETLISQLALEQFNLKGKASSSTLKDLAVQLSEAQTQEIDVSATLAQKRKDLVALLKLRRAPADRNGRHGGPTLSISAPQVEPHKVEHTAPLFSSARNDVTRRRPLAADPSTEVSTSAARQRLLKRQSFTSPPNGTDSTLSISQERALAMKINEKAARREERARRRQAREEQQVAAHLAVPRHTHKSMSPPPPSGVSSPLSLSNSGGVHALQASVSGGISSPQPITTTTHSESGKRLSSMSSTPNSSIHSPDEPVHHIRTGYQDVLSEEENPPRAEMFPELTKAIEGIEVCYTNLRFGAPIGMGCYGEVFAATLDGKPVAVKVMTASTTPSLRKAFVREVEALRALREHPNIVHLVGASLYPHWCIIMQLAHGGSLHDLLYTRRVALSLEQTLRVGRDVAEALRYLHGLKTPIIHRDVTSRNVLLQLVNGSLPPVTPVTSTPRVDASVGYQALLSDFGIARTKKGSRSADQLSPTGPRRFRAPEVANKGPDGRYHYSRRVDVYMFGTVLFEMLYSREPWPQDLPDDRIIQQRVAGTMPQLPDLTASGQPVPPELRSVIIATWNEQPKLRPNIGAVSKLLELLVRRMRPSRKNSAAAETPAQP